MSKSGSEDRHELLKVALGEAEADLAILNGEIVNVYTGEVMPGQSVLVKGKRIAYVGKNAAPSIGPATSVIDAAGKTLVPGFIDGHAHIACEYTIAELVKYAAAGGTTTIITETAEVAFPLGYRGIVEFLRSARGQPVKIFITAAPMVSISPTSRRNGLTVAELRKLLRRKEVLGLGESYWAPVVGGDSRVLELISETLKAGKRVEGHTSGARDRKLQAYVATGATSCHEPITVEEVLERLRLGLSVMVREGEIRRELETVAPVSRAGISLRRLGLATDGIGPWQLTTDGYMEFVVQRTINLGFDPITAIQMATLNVAEHFGLDGDIGGIAPGRYADIIIIPDIRTIKPEYVISSGQVVARDGRLLVAPRDHRYPPWVFESINLGDFTADRLAIRANGRQAKVRLIDQITSLVTREAIVEVPVRDGQLQPDTERDILKVAAIDRKYDPGQTFTGLIRGIGLRRGAIATSAAWDSTNMIVVGASDADMMAAVDRLAELHGGMVLCSGGRVVAEVSFPVGGIISTEPMEVISRRLQYFQQKAVELGCTSSDIRLTVAALTGPAIAHLRICEQGLFNLRENQFVSLLVE